jgi:hypothetical protein
VVEVGERLTNTAWYNQQTQGDKMKKCYLEISSLRAGPGGWRCPCCNPYNTSPRRMKRKARRHVRRNNRQMLHKEIDLSLVDGLET